jgi:hypothetical protein
MSARKALRNPLALSGFAARAAMKRIASPSIELLFWQASFPSNVSMEGWALSSLPVGIRPLRLLDQPHALAHKIAVL